MDKLRPLTWQSAVTVPSAASLLHPGTEQTVFEGKKSRRRKESTPAITRRGQRHMEETTEVS